MAALPRRPVALLVILALALLGASATALADGRDVLADYEDNGRIDACYTRAEFQEALRLARDDQRQYGAAVDVILDAQITNVARPGEPCGAPGATTAVPVEDDSGSGLAIWIGLAVAVGAVALGAGAWARRGAGRPGGDGPGDEPGA